MVQRIAQGCPKALALPSTPGRDTDVMARGCAGSHASVRSCRTRFDSWTGYLKENRPRWCQERADNRQTAATSWCSRSDYESVRRGSTPRRGARLHVLGVLRIAHDSAKVATTASRRCPGFDSRRGHRQQDAGARRHGDRLQSGMKRGRLPPAYLTAQLSGSDYILLR